MRIQLKQCLIILLLCLNILEAVGQSTRHRVLPASAWKVVPGGKSTSCSDGSRYSFFVRDGDPKRLLIYFQGGGACWSAATCDLNQKLYRASLDGVDPQTEVGVFDFSNRENPFLNYTVAFVPYCTGDAHLGNRTVTYPADNSGSASITVRHNGYANASAALRWIFARLSPQRIVVAGGSAGSISSPFYAGRVADNYKNASIAQFGDSSGGLRSPLIPNLLQIWGAIDVLQRFSHYRGQENLNLDQFYVLEARRHPTLVFSQFNNSRDVVQIAGLRQIGVDLNSLDQQLEQTYAAIRKTVPGFRSFTAPGTLHVLLNRPEFYTTEVNGIRLRDWVDDLASGRTVKSVGSVVRKDVRASTPALGTKLNLLSLHVCTAAIDTGAENEKQAKQ